MIVDFLRTNIRRSLTKEKALALEDKIPSLEDLGRKFQDIDEFGLYLHIPFCEQIDKISRIRGIFFYFHTPYYGYDDLYIEPTERNEILGRLLTLKRKYKILNSQAGLKSALNNDWECPLDICRVYEKGEVYECCRYPGDPKLCQNCGYLSYAEIDQTLKLKPSAILNALKYF